MGASVGGQLHLGVVGEGAVLYADGQPKDLPHCPHSLIRRQLRCNPVSDVYYLPIPIHFPAHWHEDVGFQAVTAGVGGAWDGWIGGVGGRYKEGEGRKAEGEEELVVVRSGHVWNRRLLLFIVLLGSPSGCLRSFVCLERTKSLTFERTRDKIGMGGSHHCPPSSDWHTPPSGRSDR